MEMQPVKRIVCLRVIPTAIWEPVTTLTITGERKTFYPEDCLFSYTKLNQKSDGSFAKVLSLSNNRRLVTVDILNQLYQIEDDLFVGYLDLGEKAVPCEEGVNVKVYGREEFIHFETRNFKTKYVWSN